MDRKLVTRGTGIPGSTEWNLSRGCPGSTSEFSSIGRRGEGGRGGTETGLSVRWYMLRWFTYVCILRLACTFTCGA